MSEERLPSTRDVVAAIRAAIARHEEPLAAGRHIAAPLTRADGALDRSLYDVK